MQKSESIKPSVCLPLGQLADVVLNFHISLIWFIISHIFYFLWALHTYLPVPPPPSSCVPNDQWLVHRVTEGQEWEKRTLSASSALIFYNLGQYHIKSKLSTTQSSTALPLCSSRIEALAWLPSTPHCLHSSFSPPLPGEMSGCSCQTQLCCHWKLALRCLPTGPQPRHACAFPLPLPNTMAPTHSSSTLLYLAEFQKMFPFSSFVIFQPFKKVMLFVEERYD